MKYNCSSFRIDVLADKPIYVLRACNNFDLVWSKAVPKEFELGVQFRQALRDYFSITVNRSVVAAELSHASSRLIWKVKIGFIGRQRVGSGTLRKAGKAMI